MDNDLIVRAVELIRYLAGERCECDDADMPKGSCAACQASAWLNDLERRPHAV